MKAADREAKAFPVRCFLMYNLIDGAPDENERILLFHGDDRIFRDVLFRNGSQDSEARFCGA